MNVSWRVLGLVDSYSSYRVYDCNGYVIKRFDGESVCTRQDIVHIGSLVNHIGSRFRLSLWGPGISYLWIRGPAVNKTKKG